VTRTVSVSILEIYLDRVRDLLDARHGTAAEAKLEVRQTGEGGHFVPGLTAKTVQSRAEVDALVAFAHKRRSQAATDCNLHSSRSHLVVQVEVRTAHAATGEVTLGRLHLVDLAGSERVKESRAEGQQLKETLSINKSLSALGEVVAARAAPKGTRSHVPYRNSTLTFLLQDALSGDSKMAFIVCVSGAADNAEETASSLAFASRAVTVEQARAATKNVLVPKAAGGVEGATRKEEGGADAA